MKRPKSITPPLPKSGIANKKCAFKETRDCSPDMSKDHIMSASVLNSITDDKITLTSPAYSRSVSVKSSSLTTKWLCRRHNNALSPLDAEAQRLFNAVASVDDVLEKKIDNPQRFFLFHGWDIERWFLKTLLASYVGKTTNIRQGSNPLPAYFLKLFEQPLAAPYGLYCPIPGQAGGEKKMQLSKQATMSLITNNSVVAGIDVELHGLELKLVAYGPPAEIESFRQTHALRPQHIGFFKGNEVVIITLIWHEKSDTSIWLSKGDPHALLPSGIAT